MAYTDDAVKAKLSALNETQEGIVTVAQWVMFHRRHAERTAQLWLQKLRDSPAPKRLNLIYLANEVAQQSRARRKEDFLIAFSPIIAEATAIAYKGSSNDIQQKLRRVVEVWRQRSIFELPIQEAVEARIDGRSSFAVPFIRPAYSVAEIDKSRSTGKKPLLGGSLFSSSSGSTPSELQPLVPLQVAVSKATVASTASATAANAEYDKMHDPNTPLPTPPVHAARLSQLLKALANAESSVSEVIKSRTALIEGLEKLLETNRSALSKEQSMVAQLTARKSETETTKREVEDAIMRGLSAENSPAVNHGDAGLEGEHISRPEVEALTPPPVEAITPLGSPKQAAQESDFSAVPQPQILGGFTLPGFGNPADASLPPVGFPAVGLGEHQTDGSNGLHAKKRKVTHEEEDYAQFAGGDLDADVAELLKQEGDAQQ
ncbi:regulation of nuclear pre-mRNA domain containing protein 1B [Aspergillus brasiliensis]|nr:regulation of nuclear pre-mRNA domain containing protein 1B [Aspergillus brasiliensis]